MAFDDLLNELERRRQQALAMGGPERLARRKAAGVLNARERIDYLFDPGTFIESGLLATSAYPGAGDRSPADGKIAGYGEIRGRTAAVVANDFTVMGASSAATNMKKIGQMKRAAVSRGMPLVFLGESSGARLPDNMGARGMGSLLGQDPHQYLRARESPWVSAALGLCYGSSTWYSVLADFNVMRKGAIVAVSSSLLASLAMNDTVEAEELGGWRVHAEITGFADQVADTDEEAIDAIKMFLSYLPGNHTEAPPVAPVTPGSGDKVRDIYRILPESRTQVYDMRKVLQCIVDNESWFELKARFGKAAVTALARLNGRTVGLIANNPLFKGGALDADACDKIVSFLVLCDSYNIPILMFVDTPGFSIGVEAERKRAPGKIMNFMNALALVTVPKLTVLVRKTYGQAYINMGGGRNSDEFLAWPTAEISFMDPRYAVTVVSGLKPGDPGFEEQRQVMEKDSSVYDIASIYAVQDVIRPEATRDYLIRMLEVHQLRHTRGVGRHLMATWPTSF
ncbi:MAG TPA: carboxyl transferase domain-containing protein [Burkholderiales bacterium]|nr:carboxyl transferase domain-containing protein [Burkholderiales bacterium]